MRKIIYTLIFVGIMVGASSLFLPSYLSTSVNTNDVEITVPKGASLSYVSNELYNKGIIKSKIWFKYTAKKAEVDRKIKPGTYLIPSNSSLDIIFTLLEKGIPDEPVVLTIPEGFTLYQIAQKVEELGFFSKTIYIPCHCTIPTDATRNLYPVVHPEAPFTQDIERLANLIEELVSK